MAQTTKITKAMRFEELKSYVEGNEELTAFLDNEIALIKKKNENRKPTEKQEENAKLAEEVYQVLAEADKPLTIKDITKAKEEWNDFSSQRVVQLLKKLGDRVTKEYDKKTPVYKVAD